MIKIAFHGSYAHPLPEGHRFPMLKYELIPEQLLHQGIVKQQQFFSPDLVSEEVICLAHQRSYWQSLKELALPAKEQRRIGFPLTKQLIDRECRIVQGTIQGALLAKKYGIAFNVAGGTHHAGSNWGEGFCLLNDQAVAANYLLNNKLSHNILIIDLDVHQGNGTAQIFNRCSNVFTFSMHGENNFPFRKEKSDLDVGLDDGCLDAEYLDRLRLSLNFFESNLKPDFVFYLAGVDVLGTDKLGKLKLSRSACRQRDEMVFAYCKRQNLPVQVSMGGGYSSSIRDIVDAHCATFKAGIDIFEEL
ncbi:histone deacetylase family protein [Pedobacter duraquae]|uniref:Acetoin utilization deacetylase AcuC-like enzyme n=1 Tax=Pedobacter duraquae TaxID=425511 RepID=A0A4R6IPC3_9SPHI|nr:histone deacetylase [Pedobacter duraquae]TDO24037.1 acetoin utilization deacetylase AcuC-like enzyme [Pedobacter duraquae]